MAVADQEIADALRRSFLGRLSREVVDELIADGQRTDYPAGSTIYRERAAPRTELVVQGLLRLFMSSPDGRMVTVRYAREADVLGIAVMVGGPANVAVLTVTDSSLFSIDGRRLNRTRRIVLRNGFVAGTWALDPGPYADRCLLRARLPGRLSPAEGTCLEQETIRIAALLDGRGTRVDGLAVDSL